MEIENVAIDKLIQYEFNNKIHDDTQIDRIANSIKEFWFLQPLVIEKDNTIIVWHWRYLWAKKLWLKELPCVRVENLTDEQIKKYRILDNRLNESAYNMENLKVELDELDNFNIWDLEISVDELFPDLQELDDEEQKVEEDEAPKVSAEAKIVGGGDLISLWNHRLLCGDATKIEDLEELMNWEKADLIFTDPPYNVDYSNADRPKAWKTDLWRIKNDKMNDEEFLSFIQQVYINLDEISKPDSSFYIRYASMQTLPFVWALKNTNIKENQQIIWKKPMLLWRWKYQRSHEPCIFATKWSPYFTDDRTKTTVRDFGWYDKSKNVHPTQKPLFLPTEAIKNSSKPDWIVLDVFGWSWSTLIACEQLNRKCFMLELDPKYCEVIIKRFHKINPDAEIKCLNRNIDLTVLFDEE